MDYNTPIKLLEILRELYDKDPTDVLSTPELADRLKISIKEAQAGLIYLKDKDWITSYLQMGMWLQKINGNGIDELQQRKLNSKNLTNNTEQNTMDDKLTKLESKIKEASLEKERRKEVAEQKFFGSFIEMIDILRDELKHRKENTNEIAEIKAKISKLENLFSNPHVQLIDNVYRPCYNTMMNVFQDKEFITHIPTNPWNSLEQYWKLKTEDDIKQLFKNFSKELEIWHKMWIIDFGNKFTRQKDQLGEILKPVFEKNNLLNENGFVNYGAYSQPPKEWLNNVQYVIFNENIKNRDELYQILKNEARRRYGEEYSQHLDDWHDTKPELFTDLLEIIPDLIKSLGTKFSYAEIDKQRKVLKDIIEKLISALKEKLK